MFSTRQCSSSLPVVRHLTSNALIRTVIGTLQNSVVSYSTLQLTYLLIVGIATQAAGIYMFWFVQKRYQISTKAVSSDRLRSAMLPDL